MLAGRSLTLLCSSCTASYPSSRIIVSSVAWLNWDVVYAQLSCEFASVCPTRCLLLNTRCCASVAKDMQLLQKEEIAKRDAFQAKHSLPVVMLPHEEYMVDLNAEEEEEDEEEGERVAVLNSDDKEYLCQYCRCFMYLSQVCCHCPGADANMVSVRAATPHACVS